MVASYFNSHNTSAAAEMCTRNYNIAVTEKFNWTHHICLTSSTCCCILPA